ncbi:uncharacterized protein LOC119472549 isoform X1 [Cebus imitator]|uniref:uncharacterized protein LOC119472549 isoform X1 n=1 Tax=Cebus imitator TaxID=2715852 RepID=UPI0018995E55|nr:uncharacterized protein LOC119472549 isoform X1 [Cebus imitator]
MELSSMKICAAIPTSRALPEVVRRMPRKRISGLEALLPQDQNHSESPGQKDVDTAKEYGEKTRHICMEKGRRQCTLESLAVPEWLRARSRYRLARPEANLGLSLRRPINWPSRRLRDSWAKMERWLNSGT